MCPVVVEMHAFFFFFILIDLASYDVCAVYCVYTSLQGGYRIHSFVCLFDVYGFVLHLFQCADMRGALYADLWMCIYPCVV